MNRWQHIKAAMSWNTFEKHESEPNFLVQRGNVATASVPAAYAAINLLSASLTTLPRQVLTGKYDEYVPAHPLNALMQEPSSMMDGYQFWRLIFHLWVSTGNAYAHIKRDRNGLPIELVPVRVHDTKVRETTRGRRLIYDVEVIDPNTGTTGLGTERRTVLAVNMIAFHGPGFDGIKSPSPVVYAAKTTLENMQQAAAHQNSQLKNGVNTSNVLTTAIELQTIGAETLKEIQKSISEQLTGARNAGKVAVLPPGIEPAGMDGMSAVDMQLIELLKWSVEDIARVFNVPPARLGHYHEGFRVSTFQHQAADWERYTIYPLALALDAQLNRKLLSVIDRQQDLRIKNRTDMISAGSLAEQIDAADHAVTRGGLLTINEGREMLRRAPREDGDRLVEPKGAPAQGSNNG